MDPQVLQDEAKWYSIDDTSDNSWNPRVVRTSAPHFQVTEKC